MLSVKLWKHHANLGNFYKVNKTCNQIFISDKRMVANEKKKELKKIPTFHDLTAYDDFNKAFAWIVTPL